MQHHKVENLWTTQDNYSPFLLIVHLITGSTVHPQSNHYLSTIIRKLSTVPISTFHKPPNLEQSCLQSRIGLMLPTALITNTNYLNKLSC